MFCVSIELIDQSGSCLDPFIFYFVLSCRFLTSSHLYLLFFHPIYSDSFPSFHPPPPPFCFISGSHGSIFSWTLLTLFSFRSLFSVWSLHLSLPPLFLPLSHFLSLSPSLSTPIYSGKELRWSKLKKMLLLRGAYQYRRKIIIKFCRTLL